MSPRYLNPEREAVWPNLRKENYEVTSDEDDDYNCIAFAADRNDAPWWPMEEETEGVYWPTDAPREETLDAFVAAFRTENYVPCDGPEREDGFEKIAIYADEAGVPTHAAKQLSTGAWTSKLGDWEDIEHKTLDAISCPAYGKAVRYLKRAISNSSAKTSGPANDQGQSAL